MKKLLQIIPIPFFSNCFSQSPGSLDPSFSSDGKVTTSIGSGLDFGRAMVIQPDGKIIDAGYEESGFYRDFALVRYNSDGSLDNSFDDDGKFTTYFTGLYSEGNSVSLQSDGKF